MPEGILVISQACRFKIVIIKSGFSQLVKTPSTPSDIRKRVNSYRRVTETLNTATVLLNLSLIFTNFSIQKFRGLTAIF